MEREREKQKEREIEKEKEKAAFRPTDNFTFLAWFCAPERKYVSPFLSGCFALFHFVSFSVL